MVAMANRSTAGSRDDDGDSVGWLQLTGTTNSTVSNAALYATASVPPLPPPPLSPSPTGPSPSHADTILRGAEQTLGGLGELAFINVMFWIELGMSFFVPSSSGLAVLSMPILAPLSDFAGVGRDLVVTAYQSANGLVNLINPTFAVVIGGLAIGRVSYDRWIVFIWPLMLILLIFISVVLSIGALF